MKAANAGARNSARCRVTDVTSPIGAIGTRAASRFNWLIL